MSESARPNISYKSRREIVLRNIKNAPERVSFDEFNQLFGNWWGADVFPVDLAEFLIDVATLPGDTVLDPFAGVGTVGHAAISSGRNFIGFELSRARFEIAKKLEGPNYKIYNCSIESNTSSVGDCDAIVTSPPFGFKNDDGRVFDDDYFSMFDSVMEATSRLCKKESTLAIELMDWPEYSGGEDLSRTLSDLLEPTWSQVREISFENQSGSPISPSSSETILSFWMKSR